MGLTLQVSNSLEKLSLDLAARLRASKQGVFIPFTIVAQTEGIHIWLKEQLANELGIAANIQFTQPNDVILLVYRLLGGLFQKIISRDNIVWILFQLLGENDFLKRYPEQSAYLQLSERDANFKRMGLATKLADLFDQYQIYRQEIIIDWNAPKSDNENIGWQEYLWRKTKQLTNQKIPDKTDISTFISKALQEIGNKKELLEKLQHNLPHVYLFGLSIITNYHIGILQQLSQYIDIHYFLLNPSPKEFWFEDKNAAAHEKWKLKQDYSDGDFEIIGNDLLTSWGKVTSHTFRLLFQYESNFNAYIDTNVDVPQAKSLLTTIQEDIYWNKTDYTQSIPKEYLADNTISINAHYTIAREVEGLYQYLVHTIQNSDQNIKARDIAVLVTDIDAYAPYINAVFDNAPIHFRYKIADTEIATGDSIYGALEQILHLNEDNFTSENVLQLLDSSYIKTHFSITDQDKIREVVKVANIRFGIQGNKEDDTNIVSWYYGLKRIMYGICQSGEELFIDDFNENFYPIDIVEGIENQNIISFTYFIDLLIKNIRSRHQNRNLVDWNQYILRTVNDLIYISGDEIEEDFQALEKQLNEINDYATLYTEKVDFEVYSLNLIQSLQRIKRSSMFMNDGITFCSLIPMRSIPFKVIAMLGMDSDHFPRKEDRLSFNMMFKIKRLGDREVKENDKNLFLETFMSAQKYLYFSYIGKSIKDNSIINPSILIDELFGYIQKRYSDNVNVKDALLVEHPLYSNSAKYNTIENTRLYKYEGKLEEDILDFSSSEITVKSVNQSDEKNISIQELIQFFNDAPKMYFNKVLGIYYNDDDSLLPENEIFYLNHLEKRLVEYQTLGVEEESFWHKKQQELKLKGELPLKNAAQLAIEEISEEMKFLNENYLKLTKDKINTPKNISFKLLNYNIQGSLNNIFNEDLIVISFSNKEEDLKTDISTYIFILIGVYNDLIKNLYIIGKGSVKIANLTKISKPEAEIKLIQLLEFYQKGEMAPFPFAISIIPEEKDLKSISDNASMKNFLRKKILSEYGYPSQYILNAYNDGFLESPTLYEDVMKIYDVLVAPLALFFEKIESV